MNTIEYDIKALKQMKRLPKDISAGIATAIKRLTTYPDWQGVDIKTLKKHQYRYRLRVNRYRVFFDIEQKTTKDGDFYFVIVIQEVKKRDEQTY